MPTDPPPAIAVDAVTAAVVRPRWIVALVGALIAAAIAVLIGVAVHGCSSPQTGKPMTVTETFAAVRKFGHAAAVTYCAAHNAAEPLILVAQGQWPLMTLPNVTANLFCASVAAVERAHSSAAVTWVIDPNGFDAVIETDAPASSGSP